jgi:hypothetical protein
MSLETRMSVAKKISSAKVMSSHQDLNTDRKSFFGGFAIVNDKESMYMAWSLIRNKKKQLFSLRKLPCD